MSKETKTINEVLTKREYFAAAILQGMIHKAIKTETGGGDVWLREDDRENVVQIAVEIADMLEKELNK